MTKKAAKNASPQPKKKTSLKQAEEQIEQGVKKSTDWVKKNPGKAAAAAAAGVAVLGAIAATLFRRKKKK